MDGSGPYTMKGTVKDGELVDVVFTKNPNYKGTLKLSNSKVEMRSFDDADAMGAALDKGDIDVMTRTMSPDQIRKLSNASGGNVDLVEMPGLEIRYLASTPTPRP